MEKRTSIYQPSRGSAITIDLPNLTSTGLGKRTLVMGVLNVTPDSFSDGGLYNVPEAALIHAIQMVQDGVDIIDIGGESTRPATFTDHTPLSIDDELARVIPIIRLIARELPTVKISIDTYKAEVALRALESGAAIINDISGLTFDGSMAKVAASEGCPVVIMHILGKPRDIATPRYSDVVDEITRFFGRQIEYAITQGVEEGQIILDPGIGFGKNVDHNLTIIRRLAEFRSLGRPLLIGPSRKAFIGKILGDDSPVDRLEGTLAAISIAVCNGADIVRVHDVRQAVKALKVVDAILQKERA